MYQPGHQEISELNANIPGSLDRPGGVWHQSIMIPPRVHGPLEKWPDQTAIIYLENARMSDAPRAPSASPDRSIAVQLLLVLDIGIRLAVWSISLAITLWVAIRYAGWGRFAWGRLSEFTVAWDIAQRVVHMVVLFNVVYVLLLVVLRTLAPT